MSEDGAAGTRESRIRTAIVVYFPMFIATLSLCAAIFNGYLNARFVDIIQRNVGRAEYMRTCKDIIDAYFQVKAKASLIRTAAANRIEAGGKTAAFPAAEAEGVTAVHRFAALGTYLANLQGEAVRGEYTELSRTLEAAVARAADEGADLATLFAPADRLFTKLNDDCIRAAQAAPM
jgi:hypothetical protein